MFDQKNTTFTKRFLTLIIATLFVFQPILAADIVLDSRGHTAGHTILDRARNGVPVVNIARPSSLGVSHNTYINFNVPTKGTILNNSGKEVSTKLSGYIYGNENVKDRSASLILNEVSGTNPTHLNGYLEVAGPSADVIVANPNGITVNGAGFINTPKATLATGKVTMSGNRPSFNVSGGDVSIEGKGLDASNSNLDIYAQSIKLNAELHAKKLKLVVGKNTIDSNGKVTAKESNTGGYGLDSSALGGIYANAITLIGTQRGVGVNLPGELLLQDSLSITIDGKIILGKVLVQNDLGLESKSSDITINKGAHATNLILDAANTVTINGNTGASNNVDITASDLVNESTLAAGVNADSSEASNGVLTLKVSQKVANNDQLFGKNGITVNTNEFINSKDALTVTHKLSINAQNTLQNDGTIHAGTTTLKGNTLTNTGLIHANGDLTVTADTLESSDAIIEGLAKVTFNVSGDLNVDRGTLYAEGTTEITADNLSGKEGEILLQDTATIAVSDTVDFNDGYIEVETLNLDAQVLNATNAQILSLGELALTTQSIQADTSTIQAVGDITIHSDSSIQQNDNALLYSEGNIEIETGTFSHTGGSELISLEDTTIDVTTLDNSDSSIVAKNITVIAEDVDNSNAELLASESLEVTTDTLDNIDGVIQANTNVDVVASGDVDNSRGILYSVEDISVEASAFDNEDGLVGSNKTVSLKSTELTGDRGTLSGEGISVETETISSDNTVFESTDTLDITASGDVTLTNATLLANNQLNLTSHDTILDGSTLYSVNEGIDLRTNNLQAKNAYLEASTRLKIDASDDVDISESTLRADEIDLNADGDITAHGTNVVAVNELNITGNSLTHSNGQLISDGNVNVTLSGTLKQENNSSILSYGSAVLATNNYNTSGASTFYSDKALTINVTDTLVNTGASRIITNDTAQITSKILTQNNAMIYAANGATFNTETFNTTDSTISASTTQINTANFNNTNGDFSLDSEDVNIIATDTISNTNGVMSVNGDLTLEANKITSIKGEFESGATLKATSQTLQVLDARFFGTEHLEMGSTVGMIDAGTKLLSLNSMKLDFAGNVINYGEITANGAYGGEIDIDIGGSLINYGNINSGYTLNLNTVNITNIGKIQGGGFTTVDLTGTLDNRGFFTSSYNLDVKAGTINNSAGIASGNDLTLRSTNLTNTNTLHSGRDMNLYVSNTVSNSRDIYAGRDMLIAGHENGGRTGTVENNRGTIESYRDMTIRANIFKNIGTASVGFERTYVNDITGETVTEEEMNAWIAERTEGGSWKNTHTSSVVNRLRAWFYDRDLYDIATESNDGVSPGKNSEVETWTEFHTEVTGSTSLAPALVISGSNMYIDANTILNQDAILSSAGNMHFEAGSVQNVPTSIEVENIEVEHKLGWNFSGRDFNHRPRASVYLTEYTPVVTGLTRIESVSQILVGGAFTGNIGNFVNGGGSHLHSAGITPVNTNTGSTSDAQSTVGEVDSSITQGGIADLSHDPDQDDRDTLIVTKLDITPTIYNPNTAKIELPNNLYGIFITNPKPTGPLIEFNPEYTNYNNYVSSDYLLEHLGYDGTEQTRRLGDAMYETQLVRNSIIAMTGQRYVGDATNDEELYINLLDGGVKFAKEVGLILGVAPTSAQLSHISEDLVWLVKRKVGGHTVLAPVVYLAHTYEGAKGGHIDADSINLNISGHLANSGNINTRTDMALKVNTLTNAGGNIEAGRNMNIAAIGDIKNLSGSIKGGSVVLKSRKGSIINETLTSGMDLSNDFGKRHYTVIGKTASIEATNGPLVLDAGKNIENIGGDLRSSGSIGLRAGENVEVTTIKDERSYNYTMPHGASSGESVTHIQSNIRAGEGLSISSGKDTNLEAANIKAAQTYISAQGTVNLSAVVDSKLKQSYIEEDGVFSSSSIRDMNLAQSVQGTNIQTGTLVIQGQDGVELESAIINAANAVHLNSNQGDVTLTAKSYTNSSSHEEKNSILGGLYESRELDSISETLLANSSTTAQSSITVGGENVNIIATDLSASNGGVRFTATQNINIMSGLEERSETHVDEKKGISLGYNDGRFTFNEKTIDHTTITSTTNKASKIDAKTLVLESGEDTNIIASNVKAGTMIVNADRDFNVLSARDVMTVHTEHAKEEIGIEFTLNSREASVFAGYWEEESGQKITESKVVGSNINAGTLSVHSDGTNVVGSNITGQDIVIDSENIRILSDSTETNTDAYTHNIRSGLEVGVKQNLSNVVDTAKGLKEVKNGTAALASTLQVYDAVQGYAEKPVSAGVYLLHEESSTNTHINNSDVVASSISATNSLTLKAKNELEIAGSDVGSANALNIHADTINIHASQGTYSTETKAETKYAKVGTYDGNMGQATAGYQKNEMSTTGTVQRNSQIYAGGMANITSQGDTTLRGANIDAKDLRLTVGGDLHMESLQDTQTIAGTSRGGSISSGTGGITGVSVNAGETSGEKAWVSQVTGINGRESTRVNVGGTTTLTGASITNIDDNGIDQGNLVLNTKHLVLNDIIDIDTYDDTTVGVGSSTGEGKAPKLTSVSYVNNSKDKEQITRATIGKGTINTGSMTGELNRDITKIQEITKDEESNTEFYVSDKSLALAKNPIGELKHLENKLEDVGQKAHAEILENLPSASRGNKDKDGNPIRENGEQKNILENFLDDTIGASLDYVSNAGILPSSENDGGYVTQLAIQLFGDNRAGIVVEDKAIMENIGLRERQVGDLTTDWDYEKVTFVKMEDGIRPIEEVENIEGLEQVTKYRTNPDKKVVIGDPNDRSGNPSVEAYKIRISEQNIRASGIKHLFTNGMFNNHDTAVFNQQEQQNGANAILNYNQMHGVLGDMIENLQDHLSVNGADILREAVTLGEAEGSVEGISFLGTGGSRQTGKLINQMTNIRNGDLTVGAHSQGTMMTQNGLAQHQQNLGRIVQTNANSDFLLQYSGAPVNHVIAENTMTNIYGGEKALIGRTGDDGITNVFRSQVAPEDFVGSVLGYQSAGINNSENLGENMKESTLSVGRLFGVGGASTHSYYGCIIGCGEENFTPDIRNYVNPNNSAGQKELPIQHYYETNFVTLDSNGKDIIDVNLGLLPGAYKNSTTKNKEHIILDTTGGQ